MNRQLLRRTLALIFAATALWAAVIGSKSLTFRDAAANAAGSFDAAKRILRWELGDYFGTGAEYWTRQAS